MLYRRFLFRFLVSSLCNASTVSENNINEYTLISKSFEIEEWNSVLRAWLFWVSCYSSRTSLASMPILRYHVLILFILVTTDCSFFQEGDYRLLPLKLTRMKVFHAFFFFFFRFASFLMWTRGILWILQCRFLKTLETIKFELLYLFFFFSWFSAYLYFAYSLWSVKSQAPDKAPASGGSSFNQLLGIKGAALETVSYHVLSLFFRKILMYISQ